MKIKTQILSLITSILIIFSTINVFAHTSEDSYFHHSMMNGMHSSYGYAGMVFSWVFSILILVALILFIVWLIKQIQK